MFEKEAEERFVKSYPEFCYNGKPLSPYWDLWQDGAEFGYNKANEWHDLRENPEDLPKGDVHRTILLKDRYGNIYTGDFYPKDECHKENCFSVEYLEYGFQGNNFVAFEQIAKWSEFPKGE